MDRPTGALEGAGARAHGPGLRRAVERRRAARCRQPDVHLATAGLLVRGERKRFCGLAQQPLHLVGVQSRLRLEQQRIETFYYRKYHEGYPWFAAASFLLLGGMLALERTFWRRVP